MDCLHDGPGSLIEAASIAIIQETGFRFDGLQDLSYGREDTCFELCFRSPDFPAAIPAEDKV